MVSNYWNRWLAINGIRGQDFVESVVRTFRNRWSRSIGICTIIRGTRITVADILDYLAGACRRLKLSRIAPTCGKRIFAQPSFLRPIVSAVSLLRYDSLIR